MTPTRASARSAACIVLLCAGCGSPPPVALCASEASDDPSRPLLPDTSIDDAAVGYLTHDVGDVYGNPSCGATLVHPRVAITAAHCVERVIATPGARLGVGFGPLCGRVVPVISVRPVTSERDYGAPGRETWDFAALVLGSALDEISPIAFAPSPVAGCDARFVGYGRKVAGPSGVREGYDGVRRTLGMCIDAIHTGIDGHSEDPGSPCFGDSGSPLLDVDGALVGVLTGFGVPLPDVRCAPAESVLFAPALPHEPFVHALITEVEVGLSP